MQRKAALDAGTANREFVKEQMGLSDALNRQAQEYAKLDPTAANYTQQVAETDEYLKRLEARLAKAKGSIAKLLG